MTTESLRDACIDDFGEQWTAYRRNEGYYASAALFRDILGPFTDRVALEGARVADIGSGTGRIVNMLLDAGAGQVVAVEPSDAFDVLVENTRARRDRVTYVRGRGEELPLDPPLDYVVTFGVLHHIPDPVPVVQRARAALRPGGSMIAWLYGHEGNELYLSLTGPLRKVTTRLPHAALDVVATTLRYPLDAYIWACGRVPLPMAAYMTGHIGKLSTEDRKITIYDQLNPAYAKYYRKSEVIDLFRRGGFRDVELHHRHGYSWTVLAKRD